MNYSMSKNNSQGGQAFILTVLIFMLISLAITFGAARPVLSQIVNTKGSLKSKQSLFLTEAINEDIIYRLNNGLNINSSPTLVIDGNTASATISDTVDGKKIESTSNVGNYYRNTEIEIIVGVGASFNYGIQTGNGGFVMSNNAGVYGNVYSNGDILGSSGSFITGTAIAANGVSQTVDVENTSPNTPSNNIVFAKTNSSEDFAQSFQVSSTTPLNKIEFFIRKTGNPSNRTVRIMNDNNGVPGSTELTSETLSSSLITGSYGWVEVVFSDSISLTPGYTYWAVIDGGSHNSKFFEIGSHNSYPEGVSKTGKYNSAWNETTPLGLDAGFRIYLGGQESEINNIIVGEFGVGDAHANTVNNSTVEGTIYCQSGSGNNKSCNTSNPDPGPIGFPISDANIAQWKSDAEAGGIISGDYNTSAGNSLGPIKIDGNLYIDDGIEMTGTIWVTGNITASNNQEVNLDSGYGSKSGVLLADGYVNLSNNVNFEGSGNSDSFIMLLTTSSCPNGSGCNSNDAVEVSNNVGTVVLNAQNGTIDFSNNAGAKSATAHKINMGNNVTITYEDGLADSNFSSGPSGSWNMKSWKEVE